MSPFIKTICCVLGIAAAGVPLVVFTAAPREAQVVKIAPLAGERGSVPALMRFSGSPQSVCIWHEGRLIQKLEPQGGMWQGTLELPTDTRVLELEVLAVWPAESNGDQGLMLELTPPKRPARQDTQWTDSAENRLHSIYTFSW